LAVCQNFAKIIFKHLHTHTQNALFARRATIVFNEDDEL